VSTSFLVSDFSIWVLVSIRILGALTAAPIFGHNAIPARVRAAFSIVLTVAIAPSVDSHINLLEMSTLAVTFAVIREAAIGFALGFVMKLIFAMFGILGQFISIQGGLGAARVIDPSSGANTVVMGSLLQGIGYLVFLAIDGHHAVVRAIADSFRLMPLAGSGIVVEGLLAGARLGSSVFELAVRLAAPVTIAMLVANCSVGLLGRSIPQLNLMTLQLPAHVGIMMLLVAVGARALVMEISGVLIPWVQNAPAVLAGQH
jgi:flagellar biosynthetic protein FliR